MEKERERNIDIGEKHGLFASCTPPTRDLALNPGICPDQESNLQPSSFQEMPNTLSYTNQGPLPII